MPDADAEYVIALECVVEFVVVMFSMMDQSTSVVANLHCALSLVVTDNVMVLPEVVALIAVTLGAVVSVTVNGYLCCELFPFWSVQFTVMLYAMLLNALNVVEKLYLVPTCVKPAVVRFAVLICALLAFVRLYQQNLVAFGFASHASKLNVV
jgi:hypothetical protein